MSELQIGGILLLVTWTHVMKIRTFVVVDTLVRNLFSSFGLCHIIMFNRMLDFFLITPINYENYPCFRSYIMYYAIFVVLEAE